MSDFEQIIFKSVVSIVPMILCLSVHEYAHARMAYGLGDSTAKDVGRLTLNPLAHIDLMGTVLLPAMLIASGLPFSFGWARPVPYNPHRFYQNIDKRRGAMLVAAAGPAANFVMAFLLTLLLALLKRSHLEMALPDALHSLGLQLILVNIGLMVFNLIPLPPLDGARVLSGLLPTKTADAYERFTAQMGLFILIGLISFGSKLIMAPMTYVIHFLFDTIVPFIAGQ